MKISPARIVVGLLLVLAGAALGASQGPSSIVTVRDTVAPAEFVRVVEEWRIDSEGLRARLEGVRTLQPERVLVTDTLVAPPDTVFRFVGIRDGVVTAEVLIAGVDTTGLRRPEAQRTRFSNCDDGLEVSAEGVICDPARLGHLYVGPAASNRWAGLSAWWAPSYASTWEFGVSHRWSFDGVSTWEFGVRRGFRLF